MKAYDKDGGGGGSANLVDIYLSHGIYLERYKTYEANKLLDILDTANIQIKRLINKAKAVETKEKYRRIAAEIKRIKNELSEKLNGQFRHDGMELIEEEAEFVRKAVSGAGSLPSGGLRVVFDTDMPAPKKVWAAAAFGSYSADGSDTFESYLNGLSDNLYKVWDSQVRAGYLTGMTARQINRAVLGSVKDLEPGLMQPLRKSLERNTKTMVAYLAETARDTVYKENASIFSGYVYLATLDTRTCLVCGQHDGKVYKDLESAPQLPAHYNCILGDTNVSACNVISKVFRRRYEGEIIVITTASGNILRVTPNHPILGNTGFVPAKSIKEGDKLLVNNGLKIIPLGFGNKNADQKIAGIEDIFSTFRESGKMGPAIMPVSPKDFHGDVTDKEVEIIRAAWELPFKVDVLIDKIIRKICFILGIGTRLEFISGKGAVTKFFKRTFSPLRSFMRFLGEAGYLFRRSVLHAFYLLFFPVSLPDPVTFEEADHIGTIEPKTLCNSFNANALIIKFKNIIKNRLSCNSMDRRFDSGIMQYPSDGFVIDPDLSRDILNRYKRLIKTDDVLSIERLWFSGHVYNLETKNNWYIANNTIIHNCRCLYLPEIKGREGLDVEERASVDGPVDGKVTWKDWLGRQSPERQQEILGPTRYVLYKAGVDTGSFVTDKRVMTVEELRTTYADRMPLK